MRIKKNYVAQQIADEYIVVPVGSESARLHGIFKLNETGAFLWRELSASNRSKADLVERLVDEYKIDSIQATNDVESFLYKLIKYDCIED